MAEREGKHHTGAQEGGNNSPTRRSSKKKSSFLRLNVGGRHLIVSRDFMDLYPDSVLTRMFRGDSQLKESEQDDAGYYILDRDPDLFECMVNFFRYGALIWKCAGQVPLQALLLEGEYWNVGSFTAHVRTLMLRESAGPADFDRRAFVQLRPTDLHGCNLRAINLSGLEMDTLHFAHVDARESSWTDASLTRANFVSARLNSANFSRCDLTAAVFSNAHCDSAAFIGSNLTHGIFQKAVLSHVDFSGAELQSCHFQDADLRHANLFTSKNLDTSHLGEADIRGASINWKKMVNANFTRGARVTAAEYARIDLSDEEKQRLRLRVIEDEDSEETIQVRELCSSHSLVIFVLGYGDPENPGEEFCRRALTLLREHNVAYHAVDIVGETRLIDTLYLMCSTRSWPKVFHQGEFLGGYNALREGLTNGTIN